MGGQTEPVGGHPRGTAIQGHLTWKYTPLSSPYSSLLASEVEWAKRKDTPPHSSHTHTAINVPRGRSRHSKDPVEIPLPRKRGALTQCHFCWELRSISGDAVIPGQKDFILQWHVSPSGQRAGSSVPCRAPGLFTGQPSPRSGCGHPQARRCTSLAGLRGAQ